MAAIEFDHVTKRFPDGTVAVDEIELTVQDGEFMIFVGPSGCGTTTALRMVAGLGEVTSGASRSGRRVALEPRREAARADAGRAREAPPAARRDDDLRHPRPDGGDDARRACRRPEPRGDPAGGRAAGPLPAPCEYVRGGVHRQPADEL